MADTVMTVHGYGKTTKNPMSFTVFCASSAPDESICPVQIIGQAKATSPQQLNLPETMIVTDVIAGAPSGKIRVESNGLLTQKVIDMAAQQADSSGRPPQTGFVLGKAKTYRFIAEGALPA
jgi:hypothetical protein